MPWAHPSELVARVRKLWDEGLSGSRIAAELRMTKNAVVGIAHRHHFPPRPSPIRPSATPRAASLPRQPAAPRPVPALREAPVAPPAPRPVVVPPVPREAPPWSPRPAARGCQWPLWADYARPDGRFCGATVAPWPTSGADRAPTYCAAHLRRVIGGQPAAVQPDSRGLAAKGEP